MQNGLPHPVCNSQTTRRKSRGGGDPTVTDVARIAGVSPMTVSRVIKNGHHVARETRARVEAAIAQLGYVPNLAARSLAGRGQCRIALLYDNPSTAFMSELLMGALATARQVDVQLQVEPYDAVQPIPALCERLRRHRTDGVLLPGLLCDRLELVEALRYAGFTVARIAAVGVLYGTISVGIDDEAAARAITQRLIDLGHRRIGHIAGPTDHAVSSLRRAGYERALAFAGLAADPEVIVSGDFTYRSGLVAAQLLLSAPQRPTAIFASNDDMALAAVALAHRLHLDVPGDLSICGFDDSVMARAVWPEITTIRQPVAAMAERAVALLADQVQALQRRAALPTSHEHLDFELIVRGSDGPPQA